MPWSLKKNVALWRHQRETIVKRGAAILRREKFLWLQAGCSTGKTLGVLALAQELGVSHILVLSPKAPMESAWGNTVLFRLDGIEVHVLKDGSVINRAHKLLQLRNDPAPKVVVINYEAANTAWETIKKANFPMVIADESHKLKSYDSGVSQKLAEACRGALYKVAMTGTPWSDSPHSAYGQVRWGFPGFKKGNAYLNTPIFGSWTKFYDAFTIYRMLPGGKKMPLGYKNLDELARMVERFTIVLKTEDVFSDDNDDPNLPKIPKAMTLERVAKMSPAQSKFYGELLKDNIAELDGAVLTVKNALSKAVRLHQVVNGYWQPDSEAQVRRFPTTPAKVELVLDILDEIGTEPVVIFTAFQEDVKILMEHLGKAGYPNIKRLVGGVYENEDFQRGDGQIILVNMAAGSAGVELTRARYGIFYSVSHSLTDYEQALRRIRRPGMDADKPVTYFNLIAQTHTGKSTIDRIIFSALERKQNVEQALEQELS